MVLRLDGPTGTVVAYRVTEKDKFTGMLSLAFQDAIESGGALVLKGATSVSTFLLKFDTDILYASKSYKILKVDKNVAKKSKSTGPKEAKFAIILNAGAADRMGLVEGKNLYCCQR